MSQRPPDPGPVGESVVGTVEFENKRKFLLRLERSAARQALNALDLGFDPSPQRDTVRKALLDSLAEFRREIEKWLKSESEPIPGAEGKAWTRFRQS